MHSQRSVPDGIAANPTDADVKIAQRQIQSVEDQAALLARYAENARRSMGIRI